MVILFFRPLLIIFLGLLFGAIPLDKPGHFLMTGFQIPSAFKSNEHWVYAQEMGPKIFITVGIISLVLTGILVFGGRNVISYDKMEFITAIFNALLMVTSFIVLEYKVKKFKKGNKTKEQKETNL
ncbi:SdpI family protein [Anaerocolumna chitinilytica]|uniref:SdpI family protein n=1 Tax=Anaerocolumna chitinilytica TaxID=1727145 RepID=A0A7I8DJP9_9FIRM|nr:SdpI family protein [Anaerocolumna chitinilytica]BCJ98649.1 hypothetical protein bsdcttw_16900 [Anaerocolumna chitinilytica]